jgi:hypothetical protein
MFQHDGRFHVQFATIEQPDVWSSHVMLRSDDAATVDHALYVIADATRLVPSDIVAYRTVDTLTDDVLSVVDVQ